MPRKIFFLTRVLLLTLIFVGNLFATEILIIPLKKPILSEETKTAKISQGILRPKAKPSEKVEKSKNIIVKKTKKKINFLIPKSKPLVVKKESSKIKTLSKYYGQKDFSVAKKSIRAMQKSQWSIALSTSKKAKDKSIHNFVQWKHL